MKPRIFIGSSSESLSIAKRIKEFFDADCDCTIWNENFFQLNQSTYDNLLKYAPLYDYAIFVGGADDLTVRRGRCPWGKKVRDNVYYELGLYTGVLSNEHTFFFVHKDVKIASDLLGITLIYFDQDVLPGCRQVQAKIKEEEKIVRIGLLPSTSLALNYYNHFLKPLGEYLQSCSKLETGGKSWPVRTQSLQIVLPKNCCLELKGFADAYFAKYKYADCQFKTASANLSTKFDLNELTNHGELRIVDVPRALVGAFDAVDMVARKNYVGRTELLMGMRQKETDNFIKTLSILMSENCFLNKIVKFVRT